MEQTTQHLFLHIAKEQEGSYFTLPVSVPENTERLDISYDYVRFTETEENGWTRREEICIVDLALNAPGGEYVGASGSDRKHIWVCAAGSAQGYASVPVTPGVWEIIVGAYKIPPQGADVRYSVECVKKKRRLFRGDTHLHTLGSDGYKDVRGVALEAKDRGLDFIIVTDHNNFAHNLLDAGVPGITVLPGTEWTHYKGHCGMLGVKRPYKSAFCVNTRAQAQEKLREARENGALIVINHPFCPFCGWKWGFEGFDYDLIEVWNGGAVSKATLDCLAWWQKELESGRNLPVCGGSDYHRPDFGCHIGDPCTCLFADSPEPEDLLRALRSGNSFITFTPKGPGISANAAGAGLGETAPAGAPVETKWFGLRGGDELRAVTDRGVLTKICPSGCSGLTWTIKNEGFRFCRFEVRRSLLPGSQPFPALISNPVYFDVQRGSL